MSQVTVDFVAFDDDATLLVFVEEGWSSDTDAHLRNLQDRWFTAIEAALDGQLAARYPQSIGRRLVLRADCYGLPEEPIDEFAERFAIGIKELPDYSTEHSKFIADIAVEVHHETGH